MHFFVEAFRAEVQASGCFCALIPKLPLPPLANPTPTSVRTPASQVANPKPEDVECMCKLLATVGGILDSSTKQVKNFNNSGKPALTKVRRAGPSGASGHACQ